MISILFSTAKSSNRVFIVLWYSNVYKFYLYIMRWRVACSSRVVVCHAMKDK